MYVRRGQVLCKTDSGANPAKETLTSSGRTAAHSSAAWFPRTAKQKWIGSPRKSAQFEQLLVGVSSSEVPRVEQTESGISEKLSARLQVGVDHLVRFG